MATYEVSMTVTTEGEVEPDVVQNDIRDYVSGNFDGIDFEALPDYGMEVVDIDVRIVVDRP